MRFITEGFMYDTEDFGSFGISVLFKPTKKRMNSIILQFLKQIYYF